MFSDRDKARLAGVHPKLLTKIAAVFAVVPEPLFVVQGVRTLQQQETAYASGRTSSGAILTYCDGVLHKSPHQLHDDGYGWAVDCAFTPRPDRKNPFDPAWPWEAYGLAVEGQGLTWGGHFGRLSDLDHAELPSRDTAEGVPSSTKTM